MKYVHNLNTKNCKREIKDLTVHEIKNCVIKISILPKLIDTFNSIQNKIRASYTVDF